MTAQGTCVVQVAVKVIPQEKVQRGTVEHIGDVPVPQSQADAQPIPKDRISEPLRVPNRRKSVYARNRKNLQGKGKLLHNIYSFRQPFPQEGSFFCDAIICCSEVLRRIFSSRIRRNHTVRWRMSRLGVEPRTGDS